MKRCFPWILLLLAALWLASSARLPKAAPGKFDLVTLGKLPVLSEGRLKPFDTVARNSLLIMHGKETLRLDNGLSLPAMHWLAETLFLASASDKYPTFVIHHPEVLGLIGIPQEDRKDFSFSELSPSLEKIDAQAQQIDTVESAKRTPYQVALNNLRNSLLLYQRLKNSLYPEDTIKFSEEMETYLKAIPEGINTLKKRANNEAFDQQSLNAFAPLFERYELMSEMAYLLPIPPTSNDAKQHDAWLSLGGSLLKMISTEKEDFVTKEYAILGDAYHSGDVTLFNQHVQKIHDWMAQVQPRATGRAEYEYFFNQFDPFFKAMVLYVLAFLLVCGSWLCWKSPLNRAAFFLILLALALHTFGLISRMYLQERPPITNLYSSAIFIGWGTVVIGLLLERMLRDGIGAICAATIGFITLVIAHHLAGSGDTLGMLQAVLDTNIWLATHVVAITIGYSAMFLAGMLAIIYVIRTLFSSLNRETGRSLARVIYGVICFATLFSFVGTVLGGIWADQSWGRFWGWDPKENGALLIVLWCAMILHARWGGFIRERGLVVMALFGNVITSFSWFGVNMLGVGLHSYGFMEKALPWLAGFMLSQLLLMALAFIPRTLVQPENCMSRE